MTTRQMFLSGRTAIIAGTLTPADGGGGYFGYSDPSYGSYTSIVGNDLFGVYHFTGSNITQVSVDGAIPGSPATIRVVVGTSATTMAKSGSFYEVAGDPLDLQGKVDTSYPLHIYL